MGRARAALVVLLVAVGAVVTTYGSAGLDRILGIAVDHGPYVAIAVGLGAFLVRLFPRRVDARPLVLAAAGLAVIGLRQQWFAADHLVNIVGLASMALGGVLMVAKPRPGVRIDPVRRTFAFLFRTRLKIKRPEPTPTHIGASTVCGHVVIDLRTAAEPRIDRMEIAVACWLWGAVDIYLPNHWALVAGRLGPAPGVRIEGDADIPDRVPFPEQADALKTLSTAAAERAVACLGPHAAEGRATAVVVHVVGFIGRVTLVGR